nr:MAG TPA: hypothetical protein [Bacteriophage sp.]
MKAYIILEISHGIAGWQNLRRDTQDSQCDTQRRVLPQTIPRNPRV